MFLFHEVFQCNFAAKFNVSIFLIVQLKLIHIINYMHIIKLSELK